MEMQIRLPLAEFNAGEEAKVIAEPQNRWTEIKSEGIDTGYN